MSPLWVTAFLDLADNDFERSVVFWAEVTGYGVSSPRGDIDEFATLVPPDGDDFLRVQKLREGETRIHLDLHVLDPHAAADEALALGARIVRRSKHGYVVMASPAGLPFCFVTHLAENRPKPTTWPGSASLVDQVCLDVPAPQHAAEWAFWSAVTGWELHSTAHEELHYLERPAGQPLGFLLQRINHGPLGAHLDIATDNRAAETLRHESLGARVQAVHPSWTVLVDPAGSSYCLTDRDPQTGMLS